MRIKGVDNSTLPKTLRVDFENINTCPYCNGFASQRESKVRHVLDYYNSEIVTLEYRQERLYCTACKKRFDAVPPEVEPKRNHTRRFSAHIAEEAIKATFAEVSDRCFISESAVKRTFLQFVQEGLSKRKLKVSETTLAIYMVNIGNQRYFLLWDPDTSEPIELVPYDGKRLAEAIDAIAQNGTLFVIIADPSDELIGSAVKPAGYPVVTSIRQCYYLLQDQMRIDITKELGTSAKLATIERLLLPRKQLKKPQQKKVDNLLEKYPKLERMHAMLELFNLYCGFWDGYDVFEMWLPEAKEAVPEWNGLYRKIEKAREEIDLYFYADSNKYTSIPHDFENAAHETITCLQMTYGSSFEVTRARLLYNSIPDVDPIPLVDTVLWRQSYLE